MIKRIKIAAFQTQSELVVAQSKLESLGISTWVEDELTIQSYSFLSNAVGGVKLFVSEVDFQEAFKVLLECGFIDGKVPTQSNLDRLLSDPKKFRLIKKITIAFFAVVGITTFILFTLMIVN